NISVFGEKHGYQEPHDTGFERVQREQSATIVWNTLAEIQPKKLPLIWNTFPFHPHKPDKPLTNRRPRKPEMRQGADFLNMMIDLFHPEQIVAIGNVAHETLTGMGHDCVKVRHPAQGGKNDFVAGLTAIFAEL
ncbi:MAG: uracil-DNA glycosylase, partial [Aggregatilineales bacterium]